MKKTLIATAIAGAMSFSVAAQAAPTVYGNIQIAVDVEADNKAGDNGSTIGFKGEEALNNGLVGIYKAEFEHSAGAAKTSGGLIKGDQAYLGVKGGFGTIRVGSMDTVGNDLIEDAIYVNEFTNADYSAFLSNGSSREIQQVQYSNDFGGFEVRASVNLNGKGVVSTLASTDANDDGDYDDAGDTKVTDADLENAMQFGVKAAVAEGVSVAAAFDTYQATTGVAATMEMEALTVGASFMTSDVFDSVISASGAFNYGAGNVYGIFSMYDTGSSDDTRTALGATYNLGEAMYVFVETASSDAADETGFGAALVF